MLDVPGAGSVYKASGKPRPWQGQHTGWLIKCFSTTDTVYIMCGPVFACSVCHGLFLPLLQLSLHWMLSSAIKKAAWTQKQRIVTLTYFSFDTVIEWLRTVNLQNHQLAAQLHSATNWFPFSLIRLAWMSLSRWVNRAERRRMLTRLRPSGPMGKNPADTGACRMWAAVCGQIQALK